MWNGEVYGHLIPIGDGDSIPLLKRQLTIGRSEECDITFRSAPIAPQLCTLSREEGGWRICNIPSPPQLAVNGQPTTEMVLSTGDVIHIGSRLYTLRCDSPKDEEQAPGGKTGSQ